MFEGVRYSSLAIFNKEKNTSPPSLQDIKDTMETSYACIFPETFKMMNFFQALPIGTASVE